MRHSISSALITRSGTGNRTKVVSRSASGSIATSSYTYPAAGSARPHGATAVSGSSSNGGGSYGFDQAGNMTSRPGQTVSYNEFGKVASITVSSTNVTQSNTYDADGNLLMRSNTTEGVTLFLGDTVLTQAPNGGTVTGVRTYSGAGKIPVAERSAKSGVSGTVVTWLFADIHGTVDTQTVAASGVTTKQYRDPFGMPIGGTSGVWADGNGFLNKPLTTSTGLTSIGARTYDPKLGKFISVDPVVDPKKPLQNTGYAYSGNNPVTFSDPTGLFREEGCGRIGKCGAFEAAKAQGNKNPTNPLSLWGQGGSSSCSGWSLRCGRQWGAGGGRSTGGAGAAPRFNWPGEYRMGASTGGKQPELTNVLKAATSTTMPNVAIGLAGTDFMHQFPAIRIIANAPVSLTGIIMAHVNGGDGCAIAATGTIWPGRAFLIMNHLIPSSGLDSVP
ncbi:hypothetical protein NS220_15125 [Microbacterium testaceum]|uniref:RHS repeat-associated core domain-containing protein n=1 Tax=Microbacterium testaceum TaxID=2033 RepID=A0A147ETX3_MICTE|nr:RHS repeat-associated core domain-containing protein [Microbacterium testaceum]KTR90506.1 hypothetical protein NS220_15125 [Microbacterium testaceum]